MNTVILKGNLGGPAEVKTLNGGKTVASFSIAVNEYKGKDETGQSKYASFWVKVVCWGWLAENVASKLEKGTTVIVQGRLSIRSWEDQGGQKRYSTEIVAEDVSRVQKNARSESDMSSLESQLFGNGDDSYGDNGDGSF